MIVDDDPQTLLLCSAILEKAGFRNVVTLDDSTQVIDRIHACKTNVIALDLMMPEVSGEELLAEIGFAFPHIPVIIMTSVDDAATAVSCMKKGALDYIVKPVNRDRFIASIYKALELYFIKSEANTLKQSILSASIGNRSAFDRIITVSKKIKALFHYMEAIAPSPAPVLISGETGVGKELFAGALHKLCCKEGAFVPVNVAGLDDTLFSDTLFGHRKGAYTDAAGSREGVITKARDGVLFLDEIGDLNEASQIKLLRLLQEGEFYRLGSDTAEYVKCRIVMATNQNLRKLVEERKLRKDLYFRIHTHHITIPPLRERTEDIPLLVNHFIAKSSTQIGRQAPDVSPAVLDLLMQYDFPGNVRELEALIHDAVVRCTSEVIAEKAFRPLLTLSSNPKTFVSGSAAAPRIIDVFGRILPLKEMEGILIEEALDSSGGNQAMAATLLGISRQALNQRLMKHKEHFKL